VTSTTERSEVGVMQTSGGAATVASTPGAVVQQPIHACQLGTTPVPDCCAATGVAASAMTPAATRSAVICLRIVKFLI
jgi:hypothetical protein